MTKTSSNPESTGNQSARESQTTSTTSERLGSNSRKRSLDGSSLSRSASAATKVISFSHTIDR